MSEVDKRQNWCVIHNKIITISVNRETQQTKCSITICPKQKNNFKNCPLHPIIIRLLRKERPKPGMIMLNYNLEEE